MQRRSIRRQVSRNGEIRRNCPKGCYLLCFPVSPDRLGMEQTWTALHSEPLQTDWVLKILPLHLAGKDTLLSTPWSKSTHHTVVLAHGKTLLFTILRHLNFIHSCRHGSRGIRHPKANIYGSTCVWLLKDTASIFGTGLQVTGLTGYNLSR